MTGVQTCALPILYAKQEEIVIPGSVKVIGENAFSKEYRLYTGYRIKSVVLGNSVELIEDYAFCFNTNIKVHIKNKNIKISGTAFDNCGDYELIMG